MVFGATVRFMGLTMLYRGIGIGFIASYGFIKDESFSGQRAQVCRVSTKEGFPCTLSYHNLLFCRFLL